MVDTYDLFKKLSSGAKFDLKRFKDDANEFKISKKAAYFPPSEESKDTIEALDFFGTRTKHQEPQKQHKAKFKKDKQCSLTEDKSEIVCSEKDKTVRNKKRKKRHHIDVDNLNDEEYDIELMKKQKKKKQTTENEKELTREKLSQQHIEQVNIFRKKNRIYVHGADLPDPISAFDELERYNFSKKLLSNLQTNGYEKPTPIQMQGIPIMLQHRELLACAPTGSGKTLAFILPVLHHLKEPKKTGFRAVVLSPTRELAQQIYREFNRMNLDIGLKIHVLTKAKASSNNFSGSKLNLDILISTPNRLVHLLRQDPPGINLNHVEWLVLDEGDKLFEEGETGFRDQIATIYKACDHPSIRHALFSATLANSVEEWCKLHLDNVIRINVGLRNSATDTIDQELMFVGQESGKMLAMRQIIVKGFQPPVLVFVQSKDRAKELFSELIYDGINVDVIHADRTQAQRDNVVKCFRSGKIWILIATELMGRGIDFKGVNTVVNYDFPPTAVSYIHRIGRTGRAGKRGRAITFFTEEDSINLRSIANVMRTSGCVIPDWILKLKKPDRSTKKKLAKAPVQRESIKSISKYDIEKSKKKRRIIEASKAKKASQNKSLDSSET